LPAARQVKPQSQIAVALLKTVDLLFGLAAALGQQNLGILDGGSVQRRKAVQAVGIPEQLHHLFHFLLLLGE